MVTTEQETPGRATVAQRWLARLSLVAAAAAVLVPLAAIGFRASLAVATTGVVGLAVTLAGVWWALTNKGPIRWLAIALAVLALLVVLVLHTSRGLLWVVLVALGLLAVAVATAPAAVPDHEPALGRWEGGQVRPQGQGRGPWRRGRRTGRAWDRGRGRAGPQRGGRRGRPARGGRWGWDPGAGGRDRRRAQPAAAGHLGRDPQPFRPRPGAGPRGSVPVPGRAARWGRAADRPGGHRRPPVRQQRLLRGLCGHRAEPGLPRRQGPHHPGPAARVAGRPAGAAAGGQGRERDHPGAPGGPGFQQPVWDGRHRRAGAPGSAGPWHLGDVRRHGPKRRPGGRPFAREPLEGAHQPGRP